MQKQNSSQSLYQYKIKIKNLSFYYGNFKALDNININIPQNMVTAIIGPSGCGKTTLLRTINKLFDFFDNIKVKGEVLINGKNIYTDNLDLVELRRHVGMIFQKSNPFPMSIFNNVAYGLKIGGMRNKKEIAERVERSLKSAALWEEVKDRLFEPAFKLSGGQQQRLCIARALAVYPEILLMDEPASALDPTATSKIEELIYKLKEDYTIVIVTHNMQQAARISDFTAFLLGGKLIEYDTSEVIFTKPKSKLTEAYVTGRFG